MEEKNLSELFESLKEAIAVAEGHYEKFTEKGNKSAGTRLRGSMMEVKNLAQGIRVAVQNAKNS